MKNALKVFTVLCSIVLLMGTAFALPDKHYETRFVDNTRMAWWWVPDGTPPAGGWPVIIMMHGGGGGPEDWFGDSVWLRQQEFKRQALEKKYAVIAPYSLYYTHSFLPCFGDPDCRQEDLCVWGGGSIYLEYLRRWNMDDPPSVNEDIIFLAEIIEGIKNDSTWYNSYFNLRQFIFPGNKTLNLDGNNIFMVGFSMGSGMTIYAANHFHNDIRAASTNSFGLVEIFEDSINCDGKMGIIPNEEDPENSGLFYWDLSLEYSPPMFIKHGGADGAVPPYSSERLKNKLDEILVDYTYCTNEEDGHQWVETCDEFTEPANDMIFKLFQENKQ